MLTGINNLSISHPPFSTASFKKAADIPLYCLSNAIKLLDENPVSFHIATKKDRLSSFNEQEGVRGHKIIPLDYADARVIEIFNHNAREIIGKTCWPIHAFGARNCPIVTSLNQVIQSGLILMPPQHELASATTMQSAYEQVLLGFQTGWKKALNL